MYDWSTVLTADGVALLDLRTLLDSDLDDDT